LYDQLLSHLCFSSFLYVSSMLTHTLSHFYVLQKPAAVPFPSAAPPAAHQMAGVSTQSPPSQYAPQPQQYAPHPQQYALLPQHYDDNDDAPQQS
jgi:hypothetical protein